MHPISEPTEQKDETYCPVLHTPQALQLAALFVVEKLVSAVQGEQTVLAIAVQTLLR